MGCSCYFNMLSEYGISEFFMIELLGKSLKFCFGRSHKLVFDNIRSWYIWGIIGGRVNVWEVLGWPSPGGVPSVGEV